MRGASCRQIEGLLATGLEKHGTLARVCGRDDDALKMLGLRTLRRQNTSALGCYKHDQRNSDAKDEAAIGHE